MRTAWSSSAFITRTKMGKGPVAQLDADSISLLGQVGVRRLVHHLLEHRRQLLEMRTGVVVDAALGHDENLCGAGASLKAP